MYGTPSTRALPEYIEPYDGHAVLMVSSCLSDCTAGGPRVGRPRGLTVALLLAVAAGV